MTEYEKKMLEHTKFQTQMMFVQCGYQACVLSILAKESERDIGNVLTNGMSVTDDVAEFLNGEEGEKQS